jgi:hypothetical protein
MIARTDGAKVLSLWKNDGMPIRAHRPKFIIDVADGELGDRELEAPPLLGATGKQAPP